MRVYSDNGLQYRLSGNLNQFQLQMQIHLVNWKWSHITTEPGEHRGQLYDSILPENLVLSFPILYPSIRQRFLEHRDNFPFHLHPHCNNVASSQIANANLFLPILLHPNRNAILSAIKPDFAALAEGQLDHGWRIEYWGEELGEHGALNDHRTVGTD